VSFLCFSNQRKLTVLARSAQSETSLQVGTWGAIFRVKDGYKCRFWEDCWLLNVPLKIAYEQLYKLAREPYCTVADCWIDDEWYVDFKRALSLGEYDLWQNLLEKLEGISLEQENIDVFTWGLEKKGHFTTKSLYQFLTDGGMASRVAGFIWKCRIPLKIKFFLWQMFNNRLQIAACLIKRGWKGDKKCCLCGESEL